MLMCLGICRHVSATYSFLARKVCLWTLLVICRPEGSISLEYCLGTVTKQLHLRREAREAVGQRGSKRIVEDKGNL